MIEIYIATTYNTVDKIGGAVAVLDYKGKCKTISYRSENETNMQLFGIMKDKALKSIKNKENYKITIFGTDPTICKKYGAEVKNSGFMQFTQNKSKLALHTQKEQDLINFFSEGGEMI